MKIPVHLKSMITANPEAHYVQSPRKHHGKKAPKGASEETGGIEKKIKKWIPKRDTLAKPNL